eukprot:gene2363-8671_t
MSLAEGTTGSGMEYYVYACPDKIKREVNTVLPTADLEKLLVVPTCQKAVMDLVQMGEPVEVEKDKLLEQFMDWSKKVCDKLEALGHWCDYIDPCSGLAMIHRDSQIVYSEVEALSVMRGFKTANAGCCKVLLHPAWGSYVYPATMFTCAPLEALNSAIAEVERVERV